jgi:3-oxoacyl-[acyl-carrier-protein] synthase-3
MKAMIIGYGAALPATVVTNQDLAKRVETDDAWIRERTGICQRYIATAEETTSTLATKAGHAALLDAGVSAETLDMILVATTTPDRVFPAVAVQVQAALGMRQGVAFDIQAVCGGFVFALATAQAYIRAGQARRILVIGAEVMSRLLDWQDRRTCVLFGDGAGAVVLEAVEAQNPAGIIDVQIHSDGQYESQLYVNGGPGSTGSSGFIQMNGREVFRHAVQKMGDSLQAILARNHLESTQIDWLVPHQANQRIIEAIMQRLSVGSDQVISTVAQHGNTSAASIPLALAQARREGKINAGQLIAVTALGAGFTWGAALIRL